MVGTSQSHTIHDDAEYLYCVGIDLIHLHNFLSDQTNACRCKESADCLTPGSNVCVQVGEDASAASQTMSECEAGQRRCKGEKVTVVSILPCAA